MKASVTEMKQAEKNPFSGITYQEFGFSLIKFDIYQTCKQNIKQADRCKDLESRVEVWSTLAKLGDISIHIIF